MTSTRPLDFSHLSERRDHSVIAGLVTLLSLLAVAKTRFDLWKPAADILRLATFVVIGATTGTIAALIDPGCVSIPALVVIAAAVAAGALLSRLVIGELLRRPELRKALQTRIAIVGAGPDTDRIVVARSQDASTHAGARL